MAYADLTGVQALISQFTIGVSTNPTSTQATAMIADVSNEIDVHLASAGFTTVPVVAAGYLLEWLKALNEYGAAAGILKSAFPDAVGPGDTPAYAFWEERYQAGLKFIDDGKLSVPDVTSDSAAVLPESYLTRNPDAEEDIGVIAEPLFSIGKVY